MKLTRGKLLETLKRKNEGYTTYQARKIAGISVRRVNQIWKQYLETGAIPEIGKRTGRPAREIRDDEEHMVKQAYAKYNVSASTLEKLIERDHGVHIPHNHIHRIMVKLGLAKPKDKRDIRKKDWIRYERRHSLTAIHIDFYYCPVQELWVFAVIDDASRKLLALEEALNAFAEVAVRGMEKAVKHGDIKQCISDHGSQFIGTIFRKFLKRHNIKQILCRIKHPQSNGKVEKFFGLYKAKRHLFEDAEQFIEWYNEVRPHRSLRFEALETPQQAFIRKMKAEA